MTSRLFAERRSGLQKQESSGILKPLTAGPAYSRRAISEPPTAIPHGHDFSHIPARSPAAIQRSASEGSESEAAFGTGAAVRAAESGGAFLPAEVRSYFEPRFGYDLGTVRVHTDGRAAEAARGVQARTYTIGRDIVFGSGEYAPATAKGRRLLAHEMGHAIDAAPAQSAKGLVDKMRVHNKPKFQDVMKKDGGREKAITEYGATNDKEFFAECFALYIQQPDTLRALRPNIYAFFKDSELGAQVETNPKPKPTGK